MADDEDVSSCSKIYVEAYTSLLSLSLGMVDVRPLLLSAQNLFEKMHVWLVQSVAYRHHRLFLYMLHPGEALSKEVMVAARRW